MRLCRLAACAAMRQWQLNWRPIKHSSSLIPGASCIWTGYARRRPPRESDGSDPAFSVGDRASRRFQGTHVGLVAQRLVNWLSAAGAESGAVHATSGTGVSGLRLAASGGRLREGYRGEPRECLYALMQAAHSVGAVAGRRCIGVFHPCLPWGGGREFEGAIPLQWHLAHAPGYLVGCPARAL